MNIEVGRFYKTRNGTKVKALERAGDYIVGYFSTDVGPCPCTWESSGKYRFGSTTEQLDIVSPWANPPVVDWDKFPKHIVAVAMDEKEDGDGDDVWYGFTAIPYPTSVGDEDDSWVIDDDEHSYYHKYRHPILCRDYPTFSGDWRDSLVIRPGHEEPVK